MICSHQISGYQVILWYKQDKGLAMKLLGYLNLEYPNVEEDVKGKINFDGDGRKNSSLTISELNLNDGAVYYCAASLHGASDTKDVAQTPLFLIKKTGESVEKGIKCSHNIENHELILWYRQDRNRNLKLLGYLNLNFAYPQDDVKEKISFDGDGRKNSSLTISDLDLNDSAVYFCAARRHRFSGGSHVTQTPTVWKNRGGKATIECSHTKGSFYSQMYWYRQLPGQAMKLIVFTATGQSDHDFDDFDAEKFSATKPDAHRGTLTVNNLVPEDKGLYFCAVSQHSGSSLSDKVSQTPAAVYKEANQTVKIHCSHNIETYNFILWYKQIKNRQPQFLGYMQAFTPFPETGMGVKIDGNANEGETCTLTIEELSLNSSAVYFCAASLHSASAVYNILQKPASIIKKPGESVLNEIHCSHDVSEFERILWYKQDKRGALKYLGYLNLKFDYPEDDIKGKISFDGDGGKYSKLNISSVSAEDGAVYFCAASQHSATTRPETDLVWKVQGENAVMDCKHSKGATYYTMYWYRQLPGEHMKQMVYTLADSKPDFEPEFRSDRFSTTKPDAHSGTMTVKDLVPGDTGWYFCAVSSSLSDKVSQTPPDVYKEVNQTLEIHCSHSIDGYDRILWYKQMKNQHLLFLGYMVPYSAAPETGMETGMGVKIDGNVNKGETCSLTIEELSLNSSAVYFCAASLHSGTYHCCSIQKPHKAFPRFSCEDEVQQYPEEMINRLNEPINIECSHKSDIYDRILWYKHSNSQLQLLGYLYLGNIFLEKEVNVKIEGGANKGETCTLTIEELSLNSSAVYFCAASLHSSSLGDQVSQTPLDVIKEEKQTAEIKCSHKVDNYNIILWYKQTNTQLQLLGYFYVGKENVEKGVNVKIEGGANKGETCTLTIEELSLNSSSSPGDQVSQTPLDVIKEEKQTAEIKCSHKIDYYYTILWYKQTNIQLQLLGYLYQGKENVETGVNVKIEGGANKGETCTLTIEELSLNSSAVYFCAASLHSSSLGDQVSQTPLDVIKKEKQTAEIKCSHKVDIYNQILWYKQSNSLLQLLGYLYIRTPNIEKGVNVKIEGVANKGETCTLTIEELSLNSSAVYFCAARLHSSSTSEKVRQDPAEMYHEQKQAAKIHCTHFIDSYNRIFWYKQSNRQLQLLGFYFVGKENVEEGVNVKIEGGANKGETCTLTIEELSLNSSAVYFCAASLHSSTLSDKVQQDPAEMHKTAKEEAKIDCSHSVDSYNTILWYKQSNSQLQLLGYMVGSSDNVEKGVNVKIEGDANKGKTCTLTIAELSLNSSAVYFCAASLCLGVKVDQRPLETLKNLGDRVQLVCSHGQTDYTQMHWFQRSRSDPALRRIGHVYYGNIDIEKAFEKHFNITGDMSGSTAKNGSLLILDLKAEHAAVYYCAASYAQQMPTRAPPLGLEVRQSPSHHIADPGDRVQIFCSHDETSYRVMLWYQGSPSDTAMKLIGYLHFKDVKMEAQFEANFNLTGDLGGDTKKNGSLVHQSPSVLIGKVDDEVQLVCSHGRSDYRVMLWYQQSPGKKALTLIGYGYTQFRNDSVEEAFRKHFSLAGDLSGDKVKNGSLFIKKLKTPEHTATYFCAARSNSSKEKQVFQSPANFFGKAKSGVNLTCSHNISSYDTILWYQRSPGETSLKLIAYMYYKTRNVETQFKGRFAVGGDGEKMVYLQILNLTHPGDTGEYFGAASKNHEMLVFPINAADFQNIVLSSPVVQQSPVSLLLKPEQEASLECYHGDSNFPYMLWYKSAAGGQRTMDLIGYLYNEIPNPEQTYKNRFAMTGNSKAKGQLVIANVTLSETAEYFCAARLHSICQSVLITQWPQHIASLPNGSAEMFCYQNHSDYEFLHWYKQQGGSALQLVANVIVGRATYEDGFESGFRAVKTSEKQWSLTISSVRQADEAVYFCAARPHSQVSAVTFKQSSPLIVEPGRAVHINCSHDDSNLIVMLWYQHKRDDNSMTLIGFGYENAQNYEGQFEKQFKLTRKSTVEGALLVREPAASHSAVYFCAANHAKSAKFLQSHPQIVEEKKAVDFKCSHDDSALNVMLWYQQTNSGRIDLIGYSYVGSDPTYEEQFKTRFRITRTNVTHGGLTIDGASLSDSASTVTNTQPAYFGNGTKLTVLDHDVTPPIVKVFPPSKAECKNQKDKNTRKKTLLFLLHCDNINEAYFGKGTKLTVLGRNVGVKMKEKTHVKTFDIIELNSEHCELRERDSCSVLLHCDDREAYFGKGTKLTVLALIMFTVTLVQQKLTLVEEQS
ncbi:unnamed protein product, partial [Menidia menidia]